MADKKSRGFNNPFEVKEGDPEAMYIGDDKTEGEDLSAITVQLKLDASFVLTALKAIKREVRDTIHVIKELENIPKLYIGGITDKDKEKLNMLNNELVIPLNDKKVTDRLGLRCTKCSWKIIHKHDKIHDDMRCPECDGRLGLYLANVSDEAFFIRNKVNDRELDFLRDLTPIQVQAIVDIHKEYLVEERAKQRR